MANIIISDLSSIESKFCDILSQDLKKISGGTTWRIIRDGVTTIQSNDLDDGVTITALRRSSITPYNLVS